MNKITVNMTKEALFDFLLFHAYSKLGGFLVNVLGLAVAFLGIFLYVSGNTTGLGAACYLGASFLFLAYTPILLKIRAKKQVRANPEYSQPVEVTFSEESGIVAKWQEGKREYPWEDIERAVVTPKTIGIYIWEGTGADYPQARLWGAVCRYFPNDCKSLCQKEETCRNAGR